MTTTSSSDLGPRTGTNTNAAEKDVNWYLPLYKAAIRGDWESAVRFFNSNPDAFTARITKNLETVLHIAVGRCEAISFVNKLVEFIPAETISSKTRFSETALHYAAKYGNIEAAKLLVALHPDLPHIWSDTNLLPLHLAALFGHKEMVLYLFTVTRDDVQPSPFADHPGITLLIAIVYSGFYDVAFDLVQRYPKLATTVSPGGNTALSILAGKPTAFLSGSSLTNFQKLIYSYTLQIIYSQLPDIVITMVLICSNPFEVIKIQDLCLIASLETHYLDDIDIKTNMYDCIGMILGKGIPVNFAETAHLGHGCDEENLSECSIRHFETLSRYLIFSCQKLHIKFWNVVGKAVPHVKNIDATKLSHCQAMELVKCLCMEILNVENLKSASIYKPAVILAATHGLHEVLEEILISFPSAIWCLDKEYHDLFQVAVIHRRETIFNQLFDLDEHAHLVTQNTDSNNNNILHLAGKLPPPDRLNLVTGAALQMQRELQWYKAVEKFVTPSYKGKENSEGKTPAMVFTEEHKDLVVEGEQWLKDTAKSCTFAATLIATVVFAAAITIPGGSRSKNGLPIFQKESPFITFYISNAVSLFSSMTSVLMFLFILTSRCAEGDFLYSLPSKLIIGLVNLFVSLASMMVAFSSAIYVIFGNEKVWILAPLTMLSCLPVALFLALQYPLLKDMIRSTYGPGIFKKAR